MTHDTTNVEKYKQSDERPNFSATLHDEDGNPVDLTNAQSATFILQEKTEFQNDTNTLAINATGTIVSAVDGTVEYVIQEGDLDVAAGRYFGAWRVSWPDQANDGVADDQWFPRDGLLAYDVERTPTGSVDPASAPADLEVTRLTASEIAGTAADGNVITNLVGDGHSVDASGNLHVSEGFVDTDGDGTSELQDNHADFKGGDARDIGASTHGRNPAETITDSTSPKDLSFTGSEDRDIHDKTDVSISNSSGASATEDITVTLYDGVDNTGTQLATETQSITLADASSTTATFITGDVALDTGDYFIEVAQSGTALSIDSTTEYTKGATHTVSQSATGELEMVNQDGVVEQSVDPISGRTSVPALDADELSSGSVNNSLSAFPGDDIQALINNAESATAGEDKTVIFEPGYGKFDFSGTSLPLSIGEGVTVVLDNIRAAPSVAADALFDMGPKSRVVNIGESILEPGSLNTGASFFRWNADGTTFDVRNHAKVLGYPTILGGANYYAVEMTHTAADGHSIASQYAEIYNDFGRLAKFHNTGDGYVNGNRVHALGRVAGSGVNGIEMTGTGTLNNNAVEMPFLQVGTIGRIGYIDNGRDNNIFVGAVDVNQATTPFEWGSGADHRNICAVPMVQLGEARTNSVDNSGFIGNYVTDLQARNPKVQDLSGRAGWFDGMVAVDDGTNTTSGRPEIAVYDDTNSVWFTMGGDTITA